jgi:phage protein D
MTADSNAFLRVKLGTGPQADVSAQVISVDVQDEDRGTDKATVVMGDQAHANADAIREGTECRIEMGWEGENALLFVGRIQKVISTTPSGGSVIGKLTFTVLDPSILMQKRPEKPNRPHVGTLKSILEAIAKPYDIPIGAVLIDPMPEWPKDDPLLQETKTDWQMIQDLAEEHRARAFVEVNSTPADTPEQRAAGGLARLYFVSEANILAQEPLGTLTYCRGYSSLIEFKLQKIGSGAAPSARLAGVDAVTGAIVAESAAPHAPDAPAALGVNQVEGMEAAIGAGRAAGAAAAIDFANTQPVTPSSTRPLTDIAGTPSDPARNRRLVMQDPTRTLGLHGQGLAMGTIFLRAKGSVEIGGLSSAASGKWYIKRVNHIFEREGTGTALRKTYRTKFEATR